MEKFVFYVQLEMVNFKLAFVGKVMEKKEPPTLLVGRQVVQLLESTIEMSQNIKNGPAIWPSNSTPKDLPKKFKN